MLTITGLGRHHCKTVESLLPGKQEGGKMIETRGHKKTLSGNEIFKTTLGGETRYVIRDPVTLKPAGPRAVDAVSVWAKARMLLRACRGKTLALVILWAAIPILAVQSFFGFLWEFLFR